MLIAPEIDMMCMKNCSLFQASSAEYAGVFVSLENSLPESIDAVHRAMLIGDACRNGLPFCYCLEDLGVELPDFYRYGSDWRNSNIASNDIYVPICLVS